MNKRIACVLAALITLGALGVPVSAYNPGDKVGTYAYTDIVAYLEAEKQVSIDGIAQVTKLMPVFAEDFVAYEDMKAYLIDEDGDLQETCKELDVIKLIGLKNWYATQL